MFDWLKALGEWFMAMGTRTRVKPPASFTATLNASISTRIDATWTAPPAAFRVSAYVLERSIDNSTWAQVYSGTALTYPDTGRAAGTKYFYRLRVLDLQSHYSPFVTANATTPAAPSQRAPTAGMHSIAIRPSSQAADGSLPTLPTLPAGCTMAVVRHNLGDIDNGDGTYTRAVIDRQLAQCAALGIYLVVMIIQRTFDGRPAATPPVVPTNPLPSNLQAKSEIFSYTVAAGVPGSGVQSWRWCPAVKDSFQRTCAKIGTWYGADNTGNNKWFLGIATQETSTGGPNGGTNAIYTAGNFTGSDNYDADVYCTALNDESDSVTNASRYFRHKGYLNFLGGVSNAAGTTKLTAVALHIVANGGSVGSPDLVTSLAGGSIPARVYPIIAAAKAAGGWTFSSVQSSEWNGNGVGDPAPVSMKNLYNMATSSHTYTDGGALDHTSDSVLNLDEIVWDNETGGTVNFINDAIPIIAAHPRPGTWVAS